MEIIPKYISVILHLNRHNYNKAVLTFKALNDLTPECISNLLNNNKKFISFKSKENIHKKEAGPYRGFGY